MINVRTPGCHSSTAIVSAGRAGRAGRAGHTVLIGRGDRRNAGIWGKYWLRQGTLRRHLKGHFTRVRRYDPARVHHDGDGDCRADGWALDIRTTGYKGDGQKMLTGLTARFPWVDYVYCSIKRADPGLLHQKRLIHCQILSRVIWQMRQRDRVSPHTT